MRRRGRGWHRRPVAAALGLLATTCALAAVAPARATVQDGPATPPGTYFDDVATGSNPAGSSVTVGAGTPITVTIHNCSANDAVCGTDSALYLGSAQFTISNAGLDDTNSSLSAAVSNGNKKWSASISGDTVTLTAAAGDELAPGESVSVQVTPTKVVSGQTVDTSASSSDANSSNDFVPASGARAPTLTVVPGPLAQFAIAAIVGQTAGSSFAVSATAEDAYGNTVTGYGGGATVGGTLGTSPSGCASDGGMVMAGGTTGCQPSYGGFGTWSGGSATATVIGYKAETGDTLTVTDGSQGAAGTSNAFDIGPGPLAQFAIAAVGDQTAGSPFSMSATAEDAYGNTITGYGGGATVSGTLQASPSGCGTNGTTVVAGGAAGCQPMYDSFGTWTGGLASSTVTGYRAETGRTLSVKDASAGVISASNAFNVVPGPLAQFAIAAIVGQTAGSSFAVSATAEDAYGNTVTGYGGGATVGGTLGTSPSGCASDGGMVMAGGTTGCQPSYGGFGTWSGGSATATVIGYKAETGDTLTVTDGSQGAAGTSNAFDIRPAQLASFAWTLEPASSQVAGTPFTATAKAYDAYGNVKTDYQGGTANVSGLHAAPTGPQVAVYPSWSNGVLTGQFIDYRTEPGGTSLKVTDGIVTATSSSFVVNPGPLGSFAWTT